LQAKGLSGVMADIRTVTGGNITTMSQLFTDIRSLRGALALGTNSGQLYNEMLRQQQDAHKGAGATATAFNEQMKAVSAQWQLYKNRIQAAAIETGSRLLPALLEAMRGTSSFAHEVEGAAGHFSAFSHNIIDAGSSAVKIITTLRRRCCRSSRCWHRSLQRQSSPG
jgi:TP901 family phage tail tape measure protein